MKLLLGGLLKKFIIEILRKIYSYFLKQLALTAICTIAVFAYCTKTKFIIDYKINGGASALFMKKTTKLTLSLRINSTPTKSALGMRKNRAIGQTKFSKHNNILLYFWKYCLRDCSECRIYPTIVDSQTLKIIFFKIYQGHNQITLIGLTADVHKLILIYVSIS